MACGHAKTAVLVHGFHLRAPNWETVVWGGGGQAGAVIAPSSYGSIDKAAQLAPGNGTLVLANNTFFTVAGDVSARVGKDRLGLAALQRAGAEVGSRVVPAVPSDAALVAMAKDTLGW